MDAYIGCKIVQAEPMIHSDFQRQVKGVEDPEDQVSFAPGYHIVYPDGYHSWCPKAVFEAAYRRVTMEEMYMVVKPIPTAEAETPITLAREG